MRLFIAVPLPQLIQKQLTALSENLRKLSTGLPIKWVKPENIHLTLKFLGETNDDTTSLVKGEIQSTAGKFQPIPCKLGGLGAFPNMDRPRVIWTGLESEDKLANLKSLAGTIDLGMSRLGFQAESKPFSAHLTLGRVKQAKGRFPELISRKLASFTSHLRTTKVEPTELDLERIVLFQSILKPEGPVYERLFEIELGREEFSG